MFTKASLRLTAWYVAILMALSLTFSAWLYSETMNEVRSGFNAQLLRPYANLLPRQDVITYLDEQYNASRMRVIGSLVLLNAGVLVAGSVISYALARRTLRPIEDALEAQNRFTADASHELRTPLTSMKTEIEVALRNQNLSAKDARELLASNVEEIDRLSQLASGLLVLARTGDKTELSPVAIDDIAKKVTKRFEPAAKARRIKIQSQLTAIKAAANGAHVDAIAGILIDNAIKYGDEKSVITVAVAKYDNQACLTVHNQGKPIAPDDLPRVFDRFYRVDSSRTGGKASGYGLGLAIAQTLAKSMNGVIAIKSDKSGTAFTLRLALA
jgi:two-component system sensor histidine kinase CiaH